MSELMGREVGSSWDSATLALLARKALLEDEFRTFERSFFIFEKNNLFEFVLTFDPQRMKEIDRRASKEFEVQIGTFLVSVALVVASGMQHKH